jgi:hypothetical protein
MPVDVPMGALTSAAEGTARLAVLAKVPRDVLERFTGKRVEFVAVFFDEKWEIADLLREEAEVAELRGRDLAFGAGTALKPGDYGCRLVVRDMDTGLSAVASSAATVGQPAPTRIQLGTPLILEPDPDCSFLCPSARKAREAFPWTAIYPYESSLYSPVPAGSPVGAARVRIIIPCAVPAGEASDVSLSANLVHSTSGKSDAISITITERARKGPLEIFTLEMSTAAIAPGSYYLHFRARDRASGLTGNTFTTIVIPPR